jgi:site-specific recombinase XerD
VIFKRIRKSKAVEPLSPQAVWLIVKRRAQLAGLSDTFSAHSLRSGFVTEAGRQNVPIGEAMAMTGHRSTATFLRYFQPGKLSNARASRLLDERTESDAAADRGT